MINKSYFQNIKIRYKIMSLLIPLIITLIILLGYISNLYSTEAIIKSTIENKYNESVLIANQIDTVLSIAQYHGNTIARNLNLIYDEYDAQRFTDYSHEVWKIENFRNRITDELTFAISPETDSIIYVDTDNQVYSTFRMLQTQEQLLIGTDYFRLIKESSGNTIWLPTESNKHALSNSAKPFISMGKKINDTQTTNELGLLIINIDESTIYNIYRDFNRSMYSTFYIVDSNGIIISSQNKEDLFQQATNINEDFLNQENESTVRTTRIGNTFLIYTRISTMGSTLITEIPLSQILLPAKKVTTIIFSIGVLCVIIAILFSRYIAHLIVKPIEWLNSSIQLVQEGNFEVQPHKNSNDEMGKLIQHFNFMTTRIKALMDEMIHVESKKREFKFALLQSQIRPHFLYNTLYLVYILCKNQNYDDGLKATKALSDFYKITLSNGREIITIQEEIENVISYLEIQKIRYSELFDYLISFDKAVLEKKIPKLTLQPLIENALYHGIKPSSRFGQLQLHGYIQNDSVIITIIDNGIGMNVEELNQLFPPFEKEYSHFGIRNTNERIHLYFGDKYGLFITSEKNVHTTVTIYLPLYVTEEERI